MKAGIMFGAEALAALERNGGGRSRSHRVNQALDRYGEILRRVQLPGFSEAEWSLMRDACMGTLHEPAAMIAYFEHGIADAIALDGLADKWGVDGGALIAKLAALDYAQEVALVERIEGAG